MRNTQRVYGMNGAMSCEPLSQRVWMSASVLRAVLLRNENERNDFFFTPKWSPKIFRKRNKKKNEAHCVHIINMNPIRQLIVFSMCTPVPPALPLVNSKYHIC